MVDGLGVSVNNKEIIRNVSLNVKRGEVHIIIGPNGSGKSTLAGAIIGLSAYRVTGRIFLDGVDITNFSPDKRARAGLYLSFQNPIEVEGVRNSNLIRHALLARGIKEDIEKFKENFESALEACRLGSEFYNRYINVGFSGGERKKNEIAHMLMLNPKVAILDEPDSGLDIDSLRSILDIVRKKSSEGMAVLYITHNLQAAKMLSPTKVYVFGNGHIDREGGPGLLEELEKAGFSFEGSA
ncbi:MAG: Fe-S cluster assembly ATPase SufC [Candidatus Micrarchaeia archaeon]